MPQEANVKIRFDTKQAKSELRELNKLAAGGVGLRGAPDEPGGGGGGRLGGGVRRGLGAARTAATGGFFSGLSDIGGGAMAPITSLFKGLLGGRDIAAAANKQAFEQLPFDLIGHLGRIPEGLPELHKHKKSLILEGLEGRRIAERDPRFLTQEGKETSTALHGIKGVGFSAPGLTDLPGILGNAIKQGMEDLAKKLRGFR